MAEKCHVKHTLDEGKQIQLNCARVKQKPACCFATVTLRLTPMTLLLEGDRDILKIHHAENKAASLRHSKLGAEIEKIQKYISKSKVKMSKLLRALS